ncbi:MAG: glutamate-5-semialdehyde dehydrogenase [Pseudanabaenaceae cyanobacterium bins.68]|nr:glutamate-5-semialdehyde dehydrogenase [Pseudanabaenaceae cyanobacterium bins.68]
MITAELRSLLQSTKAAARQLARATTAAKNQALEAIATGLEQSKAEILAANAKDVELGMINQLNSALIARLKLDSAKFDGMVAGVRDLIRLTDPVGVRQIHRQLDQGLVLERVSCPLGVIAVIFEARPDAVTQIVSLALKSGNGVVLKGGSEAINSCEAIVRAILAGLAATTINPDLVQLLTTRAEILEILTMESELDLIIPRGSNQLVRYIQAHTKIPVLGHADGICHMYVHSFADLDQAVAITLDAKCQYPAACNAIETLLLDRAIAAEFLAKLHQTVVEQNIQLELRGCDRTRMILPHLGNATEQDWQTEYGDLILAIKIVDGYEQAIAHINHYGSKHTEAILSTDQAVTDTFMANVDAAGVFHNCSTRFADGFRYGFGAEVGISTQKLPPRGPVGLEGLITYKYRLHGQGQIVATYSGQAAKPFTHLDLD